MGTNLHAWLVTILRNQYYSEGRRRWREVSDAEGTYAARLVEQPSHAAHLELREFMAALQVLPDDQREALVLVGASGLSYEEAAAVLGTRVGTVKSRVSRRPQPARRYDGRPGGLRTRREGDRPICRPPAAGAVGLNAGLRSRDRPTFSEDTTARGPSTDGGG